MSWSATLRDGARVGQQLLWKLLGKKAMDTITRVLGEFMEAERTEWLAARAYERTGRRRGHRNGYYLRSYDTRMGRLRLRVPRVRGARFRSLAFRAYERRQRQVDQAVLDWVARGMSVRKVARSFAGVFGTIVSPATVSNIVARLDGEIDAFHRRDLSCGYRFLWLDAKHWHTSHPCRRRGRGKKLKRALLLAWGMRWDGREELVDFRVAPGETEEAWTAFLTDLEARGLRPRDPLGRLLEMIVTDGDGALEAAKLTVYPTVPHQRCAFHKVQNIAEHLEDRTHRSAILREAALVYGDLRSIPEGLKRLDEWSARWKELEPAAVKNFQTDFEWTLRYLTVDREWRSRVKTTNPLERFIRELDRKIDQVGVFPSDRSWERTTYLCWRDLKTGGYAPTKTKLHFTHRY